MFDREEAPPSGGAADASQREPIPAVAGFFATGPTRITLEFGKYSSTRIVNGRPSTSIGGPPARARSSRIEIAVTASVPCSAVSMTASSVSSVRKAMFVVSCSTSDIRSSICRSPNTNCPSIRSATATWMSTLPPRPPNTSTRPASRMSEAPLDWISCHMIRSPGSPMRQASPPATVRMAAPPAATARPASEIRTSRWRARQAAAAAATATAPVPACTSRQTRS